MSFWMFPKAYVTTGLKLLYLYVSLHDPKFHVSNFIVPIKTHWRVWGSKINSASIIKLIFKSKL